MDFKPVNTIDLKEYNALRLITLAILEVVKEKHPETYQEIRREIRANISIIHCAGGQGNFLFREDPPKPMSLQEEELDQQDMVEFDLLNPPC